MLPPFSDLKELISRNEYKTKRKPYFFSKHETTELYNSRTIKKSSFLMLSFLVIINPVSMDFLLDRIYVK